VLNLIWQIRSFQREIQKQQVQLQECILATSPSYANKEQGQVGYSNALEAVQSLRHKGEMARKEEREAILDMVHYCRQFENGWDEFVDRVKERGNR
jgi:lysozyme family protein